ncbi:MAG: helix-turn-helix domain-containing protein [Acidobacteria bacterium]|nr:helix-turn-helix domain-containing protein [Acidobacteriota bacterium]
MSAERLAELEREIERAGADELPALLGELGRLHSLTLARLASNANGHPTQAQPDELLTAEQAAQRLGVSVDALYRRKDWPFRVSLGRRVRFSSQGMAKYIRQRRGA